MVGIFSNFSTATTKAISVFTNPAILQEPKIEDTNGRDVSRVEHAEEFLPVEHPMEPKENDKPVRCPQPEPCIIHDGHLWKERSRLYSGAKRQRDVSFIHECSGKDSQNNKPVEQENLPLCLETFQTSSKCTS